MVLSCDILFDQNPHGVYFAGQLLTGSVVLNIDKPKKLKGIMLRLSGKAQCGWSESRVTGAGKTQRSETINYRGREDYLHSSTYLVPMAASGSVQIPAGQHTYTFACALPAHLPTSFEGTFGHIRYTVRLVLERPWKFDQTYRVAFTVLQPVDLQRNATMLRVPAQIECTRHFCCGPFRSGPLSLVVQCPQTGYVPGQTIAVSVQLANASSTDVQYVRYALRKTTLYRCQTPRERTKSETETVQEQRLDGVAARTNASQTAMLLVPAVPPTNAGQSAIVQIAYELKVQAKTSGPHNSPFAVIPIVIGTRPLRDGGDLLGGQESGDCGVVAFGIDSPSAPEIVTPVLPSPSAPEKGPSAFDEAWTSDMRAMPPPTYEETVHGNRLIEDEEDAHPIAKQTYTPRYPVYDFGNQNPHEYTTNH